MTRRQAVAVALELAGRSGRLEISGGRQLYCPDGWTPGWALCDPAVGGTEGLRRLRELRAAGLPLEQRTPPSGTDEYRIKPGTLFSEISPHLPRPPEPEVTDEADRDDFAVPQTETLF